MFVANLFHGYSSNYVFAFCAIDQQSNHHHTQNVLHRKRTAALVLDMVA